MTPTTTTLASSVNPSVVGQSVTFSVIVAGTLGPPTGFVEFFDGATSIASLPLDGAGHCHLTLALPWLDVAGSPHDMTAVYQGDGTFSTSTSNHISQVVTLQSTTTSLVSSLNPSTYGASVTFTATVVSNDLVISPGPPTGNVTFYDGVTSMGTRPLDGTGVATFTLTSLDIAGSPHIITAVYNGDAEFDVSTSNAISQVVAPGNTITTISSDTNWAEILPGATGSGTTVVYTATVTCSGTATGTVDFKLGGVFLGTGSMSGGQASLLVNYSDPVPAATPIGHTTVTAEYSGDAFFNASTGSHAQIVGHVTASSFGYGLLPVTIAGPPVMQPSQTVVEGTSVTLILAVAVAAPLASWLWTIPGAGGTVTFREGSNVLGVVAVDSASSKATIVLVLPVGLHSISADYSGDEVLFLPSSTDQLAAFRASVNVTAVPTPPEPPPTPPRPGDNPAGNSPRNSTNLPCATRSLCTDPASPISNRTSEEPDVDHFFGYWSAPGDIRAGENWSDTRCITVVGVIHCIASTQAEADLCAQRMAVLCQQVILEDGTLTLDCCGTPVSRSYSPGASPAQIAAIAQALMVQCSTTNPACAPGNLSYTLTVDCCGVPIRGTYNTGESAAMLEFLIQALLTRCREVNPGCLAADLPVSLDCCGTPITGTINASMGADQIQAALLGLQSQCLAQSPACLPVVLPLTLACCGSDVTALIVSTMTQAEVSAIVMAMQAQCALQQPGCIASPTTGTLTLNCCGSPISLVYPSTASSTDIGTLIQQLIAECQAAHPDCSEVWPVQIDCCGTPVFGTVTSGMTADQIAAVVATMQAQCTALNPTCGNGGGGNPDNPLVPDVNYYASRSQSCTLHCPDGSPFVYTVPSGLFVTRSQSQSDQQAQAYACQQGSINKICLSSLPPACCIETFFSATIAATNNASVSFWSLEGSPPPGLTLVPSGNTATLSGLPTVLGTYTFAVVVHDIAGNNMRRNYTLKVVGVANNDPLPDATLGADYQVQMVASGLSTPQFWRISSGSLPPGLTLVAATGLLVGTPTGDFKGYAFTVEVTGPL